MVFNISQTAAQDVPPRDPNDLVAQVLNYSTFGKDDGFIATDKYSAYWYQDGSDKFHYRLYDSFPDDMKEREAIFDKLTFGDWVKWEMMWITRDIGINLEVIDLNALDQNNIHFERQNEGAIHTIIRHDTDVLFYHPSELKLERLQRGWNFIYSKYCSGKKKPF